MKKFFAIMLALAMVASLGACTALKQVEGAEAPEATQAPPPEPTAETEVMPEMDTELEALGSQVIVSLNKNEEVFKAPDDSDRTILTFSYDTPIVHIEGNDAASERINTILHVVEETFYSGTAGMGDGVGGMLEQATDNFAVAMELKDNRPLEFSTSRSASVLRADSRILTIDFVTHSYTGGSRDTTLERAFVFDSQTGEQLNLSGICKSAESYEAFKEYALGKMVDEAKKEGSPVDLELFKEEGSLEQALETLFRDLTWYLDNSGMVLFAGVGELGSYDEGIIRFRFDYEELADYLNEAYLPTERVESGSFSVDRVEDVPEDSVKILARIAVDPEGDEFCLKADGTAYNVTVTSVNYVNDGFFETAQHWSCSYMHDCAIQIVTVLPEGMPDVMIRFTDDKGAEHRLLVTESGEDGSLILTDDSIQAVG